MNEPPAAQPEAKYNYGIGAIAKHLRLFLNNMMAMKLKDIDKKELSMIRTHYTILTGYLFFMHLVILYRDRDISQEVVFICQGIYLVFLGFGIGVAKSIKNNLSRAIISLILLVSPILLVERSLSAGRLMSEYSFALSLVVSVVILLMILRNVGFAISMLFKILYAVYIGARLYLLDDDVLWESSLFAISNIVMVFIDASWVVRLKQEISKLKEKEEEWEDMVCATGSLVDFAVSYPVYIISLKNPILLKQHFQKEETEGGKTTHEKFILSQFEEGKLSYFGPDEEEISSLSITWLLDFLGELYFDQSSQLEILRYNKLLATKTDDKVVDVEEPQKKSVREILNKDIKSQNCRTIFLSIYKIFLEHNECISGFKIVLKQITDKNFFGQSRGLKFYDLDIVFLENVDLNMQSIIVVLKDVNPTSTTQNPNQGDTSNNDVFLASIAHDIRAPLHAIMGFSDTLLFTTRESCPEASSQAKTIRANCEHLEVMISDILDRTRLKTGKMVLNIKNFDLHSLIEDCLLVLGELIKDKNILCTHNCPRNMILNSDEHRLKRVILNLLTNAAKFTIQGEIRVLVKGDKDKIRISVADTGVGINPSKLDNLFKAFNSYKDDSGSLNHDGIGLGLAISLAIVERLGPVQMIDVDSTLSKGTCFSFLVYRDHKLKSVSDDNIKKSEVEKLRTKKRRRKTTVIQDIISFQKFKSQNSRLQEGDSRDDYDLERLLYNKHFSENSKRNSSAYKNRIPLSAESPHSVLQPDRSSNVLSGFNQLPSVSKNEPFAQFHLETEERDLIEDMADPDLQVPPTLRIKQPRTLESIHERSLLNVLILDDQGFNARLVSSHLNRAFSDLASSREYKDILVFTYKQALDVIKENIANTVFFDLVLTDYNIDAGYTGKQVYENIKEMYRGLGVTEPFSCLISGEEPEEDIIEGFDRVLQKPYRYSEFKDMISYWLRKLDGTLTTEQDKRIDDEIEVE